MPWRAAVAVGVFGLSSISLAPVPTGAPHGQASQPASLESRLISVSRNPDATDAQEYNALKALVGVIELRTEDRMPVGVSPARGFCGFSSAAWDRLFAEMNAGRSTNLTLPPCLPVVDDPRVLVRRGTSAAATVSAHVGDAVPGVLDTVARANRTSVDSLKSLPRDTLLSLPQSAIATPLFLKPEVTLDAVTSLRRVADSALSASVGTLMDLVVPFPEAATSASEGDLGCRQQPSLGKWPFDPTELTRQLEINRDLRGNRPVSRGLIGVADTGIKEGDVLLTPYLAAAPGEASKPNAIDDVPNGYIDDIFGANMDGLTTGFPAANDNADNFWHGTHVAGLAVAAMHSELAPFVRDALGLRVLNVVHCRTAIGNGKPKTACAIPATSLQNAVRYADLAPGIMVLNVSLETRFDDPGLLSTIQGTRTLVVAAAGNKGQNLDIERSYPAAHGREPGLPLISVAALDTDGQTIARRSNVGELSVDLAAPGCQIESLMPGGGKVRKSGTSQAAPLVSLTAALLYHEGLQIPLQIRHRIMTSTDPLPLPQRTKVRSGGKLNIVHALAVYEDLVILRDSSILRGRLQGQLQTSAGKRPWSSVRRVGPDASDRMTVWLASASDLTPLRDGVTDKTITIDVSEKGMTVRKTVAVDTISHIVPAVFR